MLAEVWQTANLIKVVETLFAQDSLRKFSCVARARSIHRWQASDSYTGGAGPDAS